MTTSTKRGQVQGKAPKKPRTRYEAVNEEPYRLLSEALHGLAKEIATEIEVAADALMQRGWPADRLRLMMPVVGAKEVEKTEIVITAGATLAKDTVVFAVHREPVEIRGEGDTAIIEAGDGAVIRIKGVDVLRVTDNGIDFLRPAAFLQGATGV
jgi:pyruvate/2-oxoacid:ferredoxin oxidoreductase beta subunit